MKTEQFDSDRGTTNLKVFNNLILKVGSSIMLLVVELGMVGWFIITMYKFLIYTWNK